MQEHIPECDEITSKLIWEEERLNYVPESSVPTLWFADEQVSSNFGRSIFGIYIHISTAPLHTCLAFLWKLYGGNKWLIYKWIKLWFMLCAYVRSNIFRVVYIIYCWMHQNISRHWKCMHPTICNARGIYPLAWSG